MESGQPQAPPGVYQRFQNQRARTLNVNVDGVTATRPIPRLTNRAQYRYYPEYNLGYDPRRPPEAVRTEHPLPPSQAAIESPDDFFMPHEYSDFVNHDNLPVSLFLLERGQQAEPYVNVPVPDLHDITGQSIRSSTSDRTLRFFSFLPAQIPHKVSGLMLEFWFRLDSRLEPSDILDRMLPERGPSKRASKQPVQNNSLSMRRQRFRTLVHAQSYQPDRVDPCRNEIEDLSLLTGEQILLNTSCIIQNNRLWIPRLNERCTQIVDYVVSGLPLWYFLALGPHTLPSMRMQMCIALRHFLQHLAMKRGLGIDQDNWKKLPSNDQPTSWHDRGARNCGRNALAQQEKDNTGTTTKTASSTTENPGQAAEVTADKFLEQWKAGKRVVDTMAGRRIGYRRHGNVRQTEGRRGVLKRSAPEDDDTEDDEDYEDVDDSDSEAVARKQVKITASPEDVVDLTDSPGVPLDLAGKQYNTVPPPQHNTPDDIHTAVILASRMNTQPVLLPPGVAEQLAEIPPNKMMGHISPSYHDVRPRQHASLVKQAPDTTTKTRTTDVGTSRRPNEAKPRQGLRYLPPPVHFGEEFLRRHGQKKEDTKNRPANWDELDEETKMKVDPTYHPGYKKLGEIQRRRKAMGLQYLDSTPLAQAREMATKTDISQQTSHPQRLSTAQVDETMRRAHDSDGRNLTPQHRPIFPRPAQNTQRVSATPRRTIPFLTSAAPMTASVRVPPRQSHAPTQAQQQPQPLHTLQLAGFVQDPRTGADMVMVPASNVQAILVEHPNLPRYKLMVETHEEQNMEEFFDRDRPRATSLTDDDETQDESASDVSMVYEDQSITTMQLATAMEQTAYTHQPSLHPQWLPSEGYQYPVPNFNPTSAGAGWQLSSTPLGDGPFLPMLRLHRSRSAQW